MTNIEIIKKLYLISKNGCIHLPSIDCNLGCPLFYAVNLDNEGIRMIDCMMKSKKIAEPKLTNYSEEELFEALI